MEKGYYYTSIIPYEIIYNILHHNNLHQEKENRPKEFHYSLQSLREESVTSKYFGLKNAQYFNALQNLNAMFGRLLTKGKKISWISD